MVGATRSQVGDVARRVRHRIRVCGQLLSQVESKASLFVRLDGRVEVRLGGESHVEVVLAEYRTIEEQVILLDDLIVRREEDFEHRAGLIGVFAIGETEVWLTYPLTFLFALFIVLIDGVVMMPQPPMESVFEFHTDCACV